MAEAVEAVLIAKMVHQHQLILALEAAEAAAGMEELDMEVLVALE